MGWQLPTPAARFLCAAVIYTHSRSSASLHPARRYHDGLSCSVAHSSGESIGKAIGRGGTGAALAPSPERARSLIALHSSSFACAWPRQSLWQLPSPAARFLCAAVIYTRSRSRASLHRHEDTTRRYYWRPELELLCTVWGRGGVRVGLLARAELDGSCHGGEAQLGMGR